ncbi:RNA-dependent RNA polymerase [Trichosanthes associated rhabdovirus 1]|uniref:Replicase n=1 Tax=Trichosanthes associated rhabdovirus 1 TaxID=2654367 RepID=A0A6F9F3V2_9RHAB|nr:RNA-dependent RNA polymerase [Trichosanthes associated rhabdovirus 1]DAC81998.1 TPA_asm: RNA-dependent RNA polymerase [Trichosanthes associated rhabdovirus 1]
MDFLELNDQFGSGDGNEVKHETDQLPDFHLRSPLHPLRGLYLPPNRVPRRIRDSIEILRSIRSNLVEGSPIMLRHLLDHPYDESTRTAEDCMSDVGVRLWKDGRLNLPMPVVLMEEALGKLSRDFPVDLWNRMRFSDKLLTTLNAISSKRQPPGRLTKVKDNLYKAITRTHYIYVTPALLGAEPLEWQNGEAPHLVCFDADWLRMVSDVHSERFLVYVGCAFGTEINPLHYPEWNTISKIISWGDDILDEYGNEGFKLLKAYEALCIGYLQSTCPSEIIECERFLSNTIADLILEDITYKDHVDRLIRILSKLTSPHHVTQLYGLHRIWGHPIVDNEKGMEKVRLIGRKEITRSSVIAVEAGRSFKIMFCREYRKKNGIYPPIVPGNSVLHNLIESNHADALESRVCDLTLWDEVQFMPCFEIPETFNLSMVVADKAISLTKDELIRNIRTRKTVMNQKKRRGVLRWIDDQSVKPREFLQDVNDGHFPDDHKIIGLTPKERELNPTPRMFALMSHLMRIYVVITEQMLSDHVLPFFPQITMTDSLLDLTKKLYTTVKPQAQKGGARKKRATWTSRTVCVSLDFEKWNGHMRMESTFYVFLALGELFGMSHLYNRTYEIFEQSYLYLADGSYLPSVLDGQLVEDPPKSFSGHKGGMEGLRQKGWTIFTVCCLNMVCSKYNCTYKIMGMGDNQVLQITLYTYKIDHRGAPTAEGNNEMREILLSLFDDLVYTFRQLGLPLKPLETWMSEDLYLYGKYPLLKGVPLSMDLKKIMRMFHNSNDDIMTIENGMGTVYGNAASATQLSCCTIVPYMVGIFMASYCACSFLDYHPLLGYGIMKEIDSSHTWSLYMPGERTERYEMGARHYSIQCLRLLMQTVPRTLGGYNSLNIFEIIMRGFPDNLSRDLTYIYQITRSGKEDSLDITLKNWMYPIYMRTKNYKLLIEDVTSVNLMVPRSPSSGIRQAVERFISGGRAVKNHEFRDLMSSKIKEQAERLAEKLCSGKDLHIRLLHDIYASTIIGYVDGIISKVTKASTIQRLAVQTDQRDIMKTVAADEVNFFRYFVWRSGVRPDGNIEECPSVMAQRMRREGWGKLLRGVSTPFPMAYLSPTDCNSNNACSCTDGYISIHFPDRQETNTAWNLTLGTNAPYLGSITKEKVITGLGSKIYSSEPLVRRPLNLLRAINWFVPPKSVTASVIRSLTYAVTDVKTVKFEGLSEGTAGAEVHRYRDMSLKHGALASSNYLYTTRMHISTDNFTKYSKGGDNYDIHFQACLCSLTEWSNMCLLHWFYSGANVPKFLHFKQTCDLCVNKIDESFVDLEDENTPYYIPSRKTNPYLFVHQESLVEVHKMKPWFSTALSYIRSEEYQKLKSESKYGWLVDTVADMVYLDIATSKGEETSFNTCLTDVKAYERTMFLKLDPNDVFRSVLDRLNVHAKMTGDGTDSSILPDEKKRRNKIMSLLYECPASTFLGLGMFYSWEETLKKMNFSSYCHSPNTFPMTIDSMCNAARITLLGMVDRKEYPKRRTVHWISHDLCNRPRLHKLIAYDALSTFFDCQDCLHTLAKTECHLFSVEKTNLICDKGHTLLDRIKYKCKMSHVTLERLRKDADDGNSKPDRETRRERLVPMIRTEVRTLLDLSKARRTLIAYTNDTPYPKGLLSFTVGNQRVSESSLNKVVSAPTSTRYKYIELFSRFREHLVGRAMVLGDGLGQTSSILASMSGVSKIFVSTLAETGNAAPQTYPHAVQPYNTSGYSLIDNKTLIGKHNDILSQDFLEEWSDVFRQTDILISDIEIIGEDRAIDRDVAIEKMFKERSWRFFLVKDYLYTLEEFTRRSSFIIPKCGKYLSVVTTNMRSLLAPEIWWVGGPTASEYSVRRCYDPRSMRVEWNDLVKTLMFKHEYGDKTIIQDLQNRAMSDSTLAYMYSVILDWSIIPGLGKTLPTNGNFTDLFYIIQYYKRPEKVNPENVDSSKKLHMSDYLKLREVLFGLFVSMVADIRVRVRLMNESEKWVLDWEPNNTRTRWVPYLYLSDGRKELPKIDVSDYVPYLSMYMSLQKLLFRGVKNSVRFRSLGTSREFVGFPVSGVAYGSFTAMKHKGKRGIEGKMKKIQPKCK